MLFFTFVVATVSALPLMLASPYANGTNTTSIASCSPQPFSVVGFATFTATQGPFGSGIPEAFKASHLSFLFIDPNSRTYSSCIRFLGTGFGGNINDPGIYYPCTNGSLEYQYDGENLGLKHSFDCNGLNITTSGITSIEASLYCFEAFQGISCHKKTEVDSIHVQATEIA